MDPDDTRPPLTHDGRRGARWTIPLAVITPDRDDHAAARAGLAEAELLIYDWRASATGLTADGHRRRPAPGVHPAAQRRRAGPRPRRPRRCRRPAAPTPPASTPWPSPSGCSARCSASPGTSPGSRAAARRAMAADRRHRPPADRDRRPRVGTGRLRPLAHAVVASRWHGCSVLVVVGMVAGRLTWPPARRADRERTCCHAAMGDRQRAVSMLPPIAMAVGGPPSPGRHRRRAGVLAVDEGDLAGAIRVDVLRGRAAARRTARCCAATGSCSTSHTAGSTQESFGRMSDLLTDNIRRVRSVGVAGPRRRATGPTRLGPPSQSVAVRGSSASRRASANVASGATRVSSGWIHQRSSPSQSGHMFCSCGMTCSANSFVE